MKEVEEIWVLDAKEYLDFFDDIEKVCKKHNLSISHQDEHGSFMIEEFNEYNIKWLRGASRDIVTEVDDKIF